MQYDADCCVVNLSAVVICHEMQNLIVLIILMKNGFSINSNVHREEIFNLIENGILTKINHSNVINLSSPWMPNEVASNIDLSVNATSEFGNTVLQYFAKQQGLLTPFKLISYATVKLCLLKSLRAC